MVSESLPEGKGAISVSQIQKPSQPRSYSPGSYRLGLGFFGFPVTTPAADLPEGTRALSGAGAESELPEGAADLPGTAAELPEGAILVSACLAGRACRFDGSDNREDRLAGLISSGRAVLVCPEDEGGLGTPRPPAEIVGGDGRDVVEGRARVVTKGGRDVTAEYLAGARLALERAREAGASAAVLKARSPSCGKGCIYDGSFTRTQQVGDGVTTALLEQNGIKVVTEEDL